MGIERFEDIIAWDKSMELCVQIYHHFSKSRDFGFRDQIQRAAVSVPNNIAEGFERNTNREFRRFLYIAKGSCAELRSMLCLAKRLEMIKEEHYLELDSSAVEISRILYGLINTLTPRP